VRVLLQVIRGIEATCRTLREVQPDAVLVHVEASGLSRAARADLAALAADEQDRSWLPLDLVFGRVGPDHPLFPWLVRSGASPDELAAIADTPARVDYLGLNFYPQWSTTQLFIDRRGRLAYRPVEQEGSGFMALIDAYWRRYDLPILVTETSARGSEEVRARWLESSVETIRELRGRGVPVLGYTWFPLFTMIDWKYRFGRGPLEEYRLELGLFSLDESGRHRWRPTPLVEQYRSYTLDAESAVGPLGGAAA
jgi:beta-glucosidase/6-phospho-beta-glucosidase/beta-galactosidase